MSPSRWRELFLMLGMVVGVLALPHKSSSSILSSSMTFARQRKEVYDLERLNCLLKAFDEGRDKNSCYSSPYESLPSPFPSTSKTFVRKRRNLADNMADNTVLCFLLASNEGRDGSPCNSSSDVSSSLTQTTPNVFTTRAPVPSCSCVPHWQCKDEKSSQIVEGDSLSFFALDLRSNFGCGAPEEVCCVEVDVSAPPLIVPSVTPPCGKRNPVGVGTTFLGFKDQQSQFGEFPWTAAIVTSRGGTSDKPFYIGGGSLISPNVVLTVAHNMLNYTADQLRVRLGEWNLAAATEVVSHQEIQVRQLLLHPDYDSKDQFYDVALLVLNQPAVLGITVNTICLPSSSQDYLRDDCIVSGWGKTSFEDKGSYQQVMKKVLLPLVEHASCQAALQGTRLGPLFILHDSFVCAGGQKEGQDSCTGDGGSPLACRLKSDTRRYVQVGVVAWGIGCGRLGVPGVYADMLKVQPWIDQVIGEGAKVKVDLRTNSEGK